MLGIPQLEQYKNPSKPSPIPVRESIDGMFDIDPNDIATLADDDLRTLVGRLCEAELGQRGLPASAVTWGGDQNAPDGGVDVRVELPDGAVIEGFIPRRCTGFQVKKPDMPPAAIQKEMRPRGVLRPVIERLAEDAGAYIIVSSNGSVSDSALRTRAGAMRAAVAGHAKAHSLELAFYDRGKLATWVRQHPSLNLWLREKAGKALRGWRPWGAWAYPREGEGGAYLADDAPRVYAGTRGSDDGASAIDGVDGVRGALRKPQAAVRIVGLSGVGKTRFIQAVFDERIGKDSLAPALAFYTDMGDDPDPQPVGLASDLMALRTRAVLVIDNCPPGLHRRVAETCRVPESKLSVVTLEYDIRDDEPEEADVFRLEPSSENLIETLVRGRFPAVSQVDARTIAAFSGGNAKVALAVASTVRRNETIAGLTDQVLFERLFAQRHAHDVSLLLIAQACALVYSFNGEAASGEDAELPVFAAMTGRSTDDIYRAVAELRSRELIQQRGVWRAVLPHAIANRLAAIALERIHPNTIRKHLVDGGSTRLLKSFSRRLAYMHQSEPARRLVEQWLGVGGLLADTANLNELGVTMLRNVAPVAPEAVLAALEGLSPEALRRMVNVTKTVRSIAFDPALFPRCAELLLKFVAANDEENEGTELESRFTSLFYIVFSGTRAPVELRLPIAERLLLSGDGRHQGLGIAALRNLLETVHFGAPIDYEFGAHCRDYGGQPSEQDVREWFGAVFRLIKTMVLSELPVSSRIKAVVAQQFRFLWNNLPALHDAISEFFRLSAQAGFWREGWIATRFTLRYDAKGMPEGAKQKLMELEEALRPAGLVERVIGMVLSGDSNGPTLDDFEFDEDDPAAPTYDKLDRIAVSLGRKVAREAGAFAALAPELLAGNGRLWSFGFGLAAEADDPSALWDRLVAEFGAVPEAMRNPLALRGFIAGLHTRDEQLTSDLLDHAIDDERLAAWFPDLQIGVAIDERGAQRLRRSLELNAAPVWRFRCTAFGGAPCPIPARTLKELLGVLAAKSGGHDVAVEILNMRLFGDRQDGRPASVDLVEAGRELLKSLVFADAKRRDDHRIAWIAETCLRGGSGAKDAVALFLSFKSALAKRETSVLQHATLLRAIFQTQPIAALEVFLSGSAEDRQRGSQLMWSLSQNHPNPLGTVPSESLIAWCDAVPEDRYLSMAGVIPPFMSQSGEQSLEWTPVARALLDKAPNRIALLEVYAQRIRPLSWSGSLAATTESRLPLLQQLFDHADPAVAAFARAEESRLRREVDQQRRQETKQDSTTDERFEY